MTTSFLKQQVLYPRKSKKEVKKMQEVVKLFLPPHYHTY